MGAILQHEQIDARMRELDRATWRPMRRTELDRVAAEMRAYNLTHGTGCTNRARAIAERMRRTEVSNAE